MPQVDRTELQDAHKLALELAREAGSILLEMREEGFEVSKKGPVDLVTEADLAAEKCVLDRIRREFPSHSILSEEEGTVGGASPIRWVVDPLDGTTNFAHGYPLFAVSLGIAWESRVMAGVVYNPVLDECFHAFRDEGAHLNDSPIRVSRQETLVDALMCTGFAYEPDQIRDNLRLFNAMMMKARSVRRDGSAALDLCFVACGRFDAFWELSLKPWDVAAGSLIVEEAGGRVSLLDGSPAPIDRAECVATNGRLHEAVLDVLTGQ